jgi:hypothetical protein
MLVAVGTKRMLGDQAASLQSQETPGEILNLQQDGPALRFDAGDGVITANGVKQVVGAGFLGVGFLGALVDILEPSRQFGMFALQILDIQPG